MVSKAAEQLIHVDGKLKPTIQHTHCDHPDHHPKHHNDAMELQCLCQYMWNGGPWPYVGLVLAGSHAR